MKTLYCETIDTFRSALEQDDVFIVLKSGTYTTNSPLTSLRRKNQAIYGRSSILRYQVGAIGEPLFTVQAGEHIRVDGLILIPGGALPSRQLRGITISDQSDDIVIQNSIVAGAVDESVAAANSSRLKFVNDGIVFGLDHANHPDGRHSSAMWVSACQDVEINHNYFANCRLRNPLIQFSQGVSVVDNFCFNGWQLLTNVRPESVVMGEVSGNVWSPGRNIKTAAGLNIPAGYALTGTAKDARAFAQTVGPETKPVWWPLVADSRVGWLDRVAQFNSGVFVP